VDISAFRRRLDRATLLRLVQAAVAAGVAWELAQLIPGHGQPFFAPIAAVIALGGEPGTRGRMALEMMVGVALGILFGALLVETVGVGGWQLVVGVLVALVVPTALGGRPMVRNQAAASVILMVALHQPGSNVAVDRLADALIGGGLGILLAQVLFPADPLALLSNAEQRLRTDLADAIDAVAAALVQRDVQAMERALDRIDSLDDRTFETALGTARHVARRAPRRRRQRHAVEAYAAIEHELSVASADARTLATAGLRMLRKEEQPPSESVELLANVAAAFRDCDVAKAERARALAPQLHGTLGLQALAHAADALAIEAQRMQAQRPATARPASAFSTVMTETTARRRRTDADADAALMRDRSSEREHADA
jgi:uncharacterized membrane protein YgaE (UPF0421/DUF939 family)